MHSDHHDHHRHPAKSASGVSGPATGYALRRSRHTGFSSCLSRLLIQIAAQQYGHNLLVLHERQTRFTIVEKLPHRRARLTASRIARNLRNIPKSLRRTISFDNGTEFAEHYRLNRTLGISTFFCDVRSPWQKGGIENTIGRLRRSMPRKTNLDTLSSKQLRAYVEQLNNTPRKCLGFHTPAEAFSHISTGALQT